ncbi:BRCT domain protein [Aspergillus undulatus]|uniref:BRCT domain protein n=1 Tax=Aspergillus undulatus TaxID=1810928 RepID=UPI003CCD4728
MRKRRRKVEQGRVKRRKTRQLWTRKRKGRPGPKVEVDQGTNAKDKAAKLKSTKKRRKQRARSTDPFDTKRRTPKAQKIASRQRHYKADGVIFNATLVRPSLIARHHKETVQLRLYETTKSRRTYATHISFTRQGPSKTDPLAPLGSDLATAMVEFKDFFKARTGKEWENRLNWLSPVPKRDENGNTVPPYMGWFWFDSAPVSSLASILRAGEI